MRAFAPIRPTFFRSPPPAIPTTRVEKISGAMIDLIRLRKISRRKKILLPQSGLSQPMIPPNTKPIKIWVVRVGLYQGRLIFHFPFVICPFEKNFSFWSWDFRLGLIRHFLAAPSQFIPQDVEVVSIHGLDQIKCRAAFANDYSIFNLQRESRLPIEGQCNVFLFSLQAQLDDCIVRDNNGTIRKCEGTNRSYYYGIHRRKDDWPTRRQIVGC